MKYLIIVMGFLITLTLTGCANNPFKTQHLERLVCAGGFSTPWANRVTRSDDSVSWSYNKYKSRRRYARMPNTVPCFKEEMTPKQLARLNGG